ncbi:MAG: hypothetical protein ACSHYF_02455 [Verrucomicrobiaceae bacterium]
MKAIFLVLSLALPLAAVEPPQTHLASRYNHLWQNSPLTDPPLPVDPINEPNDLEDWVLVGLEKYTDGQFVTLVNKKNTSERIRIPGRKSEGFAVLEVKQSEGSFLDTEVHIQKGPHRGWVKFDTKYLVLRKAPPPQAQTKKTTQKTTTKTATPTPAGLPGGTKTATPTTTKAPRTRYIPKPKK